MVAPLHMTLDNEVLIRVVGTLLMALALSQSAQAAQLGDFADVRKPVHVASPPGDPARTFIVEKDGRIRVVDHGRLLERPFLDIVDDVQPGDLYGLLSMAFAPDYAKSRRFYIFYSNRQAQTKIEEFRTSRNPNRVRPGSRRTVMTIDHPAFDVHEPHLGGGLAFGPDGFLYISTGDGSRGYGDSEIVRNGQRLNTLLGKLLRIDPTARGKDYRVPASNPFVGKKGRDEIYAYGLRNPWRFSFDRGRIALSDAGENTREEINILPLAEARGANFGWPMFEGSLRHRQHRRRGITFPVFEYDHRAETAAGTLFYCAGAAVGGFFARDPSVPSLYGRYVYADYCFGEIRSFSLRDPYATDRLELDTWARGELLPNSFGMDSTGRLFVALQSFVADGNDDPVLQVID